MPEYDFAERRRKLRESRGEIPKQSEPDFDFSGDVPDAGPDRSEEDQQIDKIIDGIDIIGAYRKWCGKMTPDPGFRREGIMISCPKPDHRDNNPSAWINLDNQTWYCGGCAEGGDKYDIAAFHFHYPVPGYKEGSSFHKLRREMAESMGWKFKEALGGGTVIYQDEPSDPPSRDESSTTTTNTDETDKAPGEQEQASVGILYADETDTEQEVFNYPSIAWREIIPEETFLYAYMEACTNDDAPEEYHFWHGLLALGHAAGRNITIDDTDDVYGNLLVCLLGGTGVGKSRSRRRLNEVIRAAMPYKDSGMDTSGVKIVSMPGSGEYLVAEFQYLAHDPTNPKIPLGRKPVNGIVDFDEFSGLLARASRPGNTLQTKIMEFADGNPWITTGSNTRGEIIAVDAYCSVTASTQPKAVRSILSKDLANSGFLNRWIFAGGPPKERETFGGSHSTRVIDLAMSKELLGKVYGWAGNPHRITLTEDGFDAADEFLKETLHPTQARDDTDLLKRLDLIFKKLILLFCVNEKRKTADAKIVQRVERLFKYVIDCYAILNMQIGMTIGHEIAREIERHIIRHQKATKRGASVRDLRRYMARKNYAPDQLLRSLETMVKLDMIYMEEIDHSQRGPKTPRYRVAI